MKAGDLSSAEEHERTAERLGPDNADRALQPGHVPKVASRPAEAAYAYRDALRLRPGRPEVAAEIARLERPQPPFGA